MRSPCVLYPTTEPCRRTCRWHHGACLARACHEPDSEGHLYCQLRARRSESQKLLSGSFPVTSGVLRRSPRRTGPGVPATVLAVPSIPSPSQADSEVARGGPTRTVPVPVHCRVHCHCAGPVALRPPGPFHFSLLAGGSLKLSSTGRWTCGFRGVGTAWLALSIRDVESDRVLF
jgi:hypothetical protein